MVDSKLTQLTALTAVDKADLVYVVDDVAGTPTGKKGTVEELFKSVNTFTNSTTVAGTDILLMVDDPGGTPVAEKRTVTEVVGAVGLLLTGGTMGSGANIALNTTTGTKIGTATTQKLGFWNATAVVQPSSTGETTGFTAGSGTAANDDSTFTGNSGTKAYTIGDIVKHLKAVGILASS